MGQDTVIYLLDENLVQITQNDNAGRGTRASMIQWQPDVSGRYFIKARSFNPTRTGTFNIQVATSPIPMPGSVPCLRNNNIPLSLTSCHGYNGDTCAQSSRLPKDDFFLEGEIHPSVQEN